MLVDLTYGKAPIRSVTFVKEGDKKLSFMTPVPGESCGSTERPHGDTEPYPKPGNFRTLKISHEGKSQHTCKPTHV